MVEFQGAHPFRHKQEWCEIARIVSPKKGFPELYVSPDFYPLFKAYRAAQGVLIVNDKTVSLQFGCIAQTLPQCFAAKN